MQQRNILLIFLGIVLLSFVLLSGCAGGGGGGGTESTGISASAVAGGIEVTWNPSQATDTTGYNLYRSREAGQLGEKINPVLITSTSYKDTAVSEGAVYYYTVRAVSANGEENTNTEQASATASVNPPATLSIQINDGDRYTSSSQVTLTLSASDATQCRVSNDKSTWSEWQPYTTSMNWQLSSGDGIKDVYYECKDSLGNIAIPVSATITLDTGSPSLSIASPEDGQTYGNPFELKFTVTDTTTSQVSCTGTLDGAAIAIGHVDVGQQDEMAIHANPGSHTLKVTCNDGVNTATQTVSFTVADQPSVSLHIESGAGHVSTTSVTLDVESEGAQYCRFANENKDWSGWQNYRTEVPWTLSSGDGTKTVYAECKDDAGQVSGIASDTVVLDAHHKGMSIQINDGDSHTNSRDVTLGLYCYDADKCRYRNEDDSWSGWSSYSKHKDWTLSSGDGTKEVHYNCKDSNSNDLGSSHAEIKYAHKENKPTDLSISINNGASHTKDRDVTLKLHAAHANVCRFQNEDNGWSSWSDYATSKSWTLSEGEGKKVVYYECKNDNGKATTHASIYLDGTAPGKITDLSATVDKNDVVHLAWSRPSGDDIHEYDIYRSTSGMGLMSKIGSTQTTTYQDNTVSAGYGYSYDVRAVDKAGNEGPNSNSANVNIPSDEPDVGGDTDEHGCKASAGYSWCEPLKECIKPWETDCPDSGDQPETGGDTDEHGCKPSAGYSWCEVLDKCIGPSEKCEAAPEEPNVGGDTDEHGCKASAGYTWCEVLDKCVGPSEECKADSGDLPLEPGPEMDTADTS